MSDKEFVDALVKKCKAIEASDFAEQNQEVKWIPIICANYPWYSATFTANSFSSVDIGYIVNGLNVVAKANDGSFGSWSVFPRDNKVFLKYKTVYLPNKKAPKTK